VSTHETACQRLIGVIRQAYGLDLGGHRLADLVDCLRAVDDDIERAAEAMLRASPKQLSELVECTTNNETYFFRHAEQLAALRSMVTESLAKNPRPHLRVWVAGCSSGEEAVSIAVVLREALMTAPGTTLSILATDLHRGMLSKAVAGSYTAWSFRGVTAETKAAYFVSHDGQLRPTDTLRSLVTYRRHNLLEGPPEAVPFDVVSCRNVLIYFDGQMMRRAVELLSIAVAPGGVLLLGPAESPNVSMPELEMVFVEGVALFRRKSGGTVAPPPLARPVPELALPKPAGMPRSLRTPPRAQRAPPRLDHVHWPTRPSRIPPTSPEAHVSDALLAMERGDASAALEQLDAAIASDSGNAMAHYLVGSILEGRGQHDAAEHSFREALLALDGLEPADSVPCGGGVTVEELVRVLSSALSSSSSTRPS
jgi:chemotaxis methyl-accepting protein methylase